jgi:mycoredoxin
MTMSQKTSAKDQIIIVYGHRWCGMVRPVLEVLQKAEAPFEYVNIHEDAEGRERLREINDGYESVPTLVFPDGSTLTEPSLAQLQAKLRTMGREIPPPKWLVAILRLLGQG